MIASIPDLCIRFTFGEHFRNNQVLKCSKCQQMFLSNTILLKDNNITLHMMAYTYFLAL